MNGTRLKDFPDIYWHSNPYTIWPGKLEHVGYLSIPPERVTREVVTDLHTFVGYRPSWTGELNALLGMQLGNYTGWLMRAERYGHSPVNDWHEDCSGQWPGHMLIGTSCERDGYGTMFRIPLQQGGWAIYTAQNHHFYRASLRLEHRGQSAPWPRLICRWTMRNEPL